MDKPIGVAMTEGEFNLLKSEVSENLDEYARLHNKYVDEVRYGSFPVMFNWSEDDKSYVQFTVWYNPKGFMMVDASCSSKGSKSSMLRYASSVVESACKKKLERQ